MLRRCLILPVVFLALAASAAGQERVVGANYPLAQKFDRDFVTRHVQEVAVVPQWIGKTDTFFYAARTQTGTLYWKVDPAKKEKTPLFDHTKLSAALSEASKKPLDADTLRLSNIVAYEDGKKLNFTFDAKRYEYEVATNKMKALGVDKSAGATGAMSPETIARMRQELGDERVNEMLRKIDGEKKDTEQKDEKQDEKKDEIKKGDMTEPKKAPMPQPNTYKNYSPDKKKYVYAFKHNLYLCDDGTPEEKATQLTTDGEENYSFAGGGFGGFGGGRGGTGVAGGAATAAATKSRANVTWSSDSKAFYISRTDNRNIKDLYLVDSIATPRPKLEQYAYPMPGEENIRKTELYTYDAEKKAFAKVHQKWKDERYSDLRWGKSPGELRFIRRDRLRRNLEVCAFNVFKNECKCLFGEGFDAAYLDMQMPRYLEDTDEFLWWSERSGWGHYYRYGRDGTLKNPLTAGAWRVSSIVEVDAKAGYVYLLGNARETGESPYYNHLYRVKLDGTELTCLDPSIGPNGKLDPAGFNQCHPTLSGQRTVPSYLSPSKKFVVVNSSRIDHAAFATLRDDKGTVLMLLEDTDTKALLATGWKPPVAFSVKAADGTTDLYGNMWLPFDFDAKKKYPIIAYVYPGPQQEGVTHRFSAFSSYMQLSQLGFVVIQVGHRGGSPERSKAYHSFGYFNLRDYGLVDKKAAIENLAARHSFIDIDRVGIYGHSGGGFMSAAAVLQKPYNEFFKAAVASAGNHDNNIYNDNWSETYHGLKEVPLDAKSGTTTKTTGTTGEGFGKFGGGKGGFGGRKKGGGGADEEAEIEAEMRELIEALDPQDQRSADEIEKQLAALREKLAALKKADEQATQAKKGAAEVAPPPRTAGTKMAATTSTSTPPVELPKTKFEIQIPANAELAANLKGHLMLVHGEVDNNVHPANTMRLVDALIKANKRFDLLIIPGARHSFGQATPYFTQTSTTRT
jgi:dipeptidyl-peptidase-4